MAGIDTGNNLCSVSSQNSLLLQLPPSLKLHQPLQVPDPAAKFDAAYQTSTQSTIGSMYITQSDTYYVYVLSEGRKSHRSGWHTMSSAQDSADPGGQPDPLRQAIAANAYLARAESMLKVLQKIIEDAHDDPVKTIATVCWLIISMGMELKSIKDQFQQDPNVSPMLRQMVRKVDSIAGGRVENPPFSKRIGSETSSVSDKMRSVEADAESEEVTQKVLKTERE
ncbi:hypothetical protein FMUND_12631 [Fusarium mundagurra]|uniref:Uncharacterized protein n=1 Tax=Fusarium mundagurra TaxID=1567541 RepID=A0A8H5Y2B1_9HYPO|nr:hypothetical protein FMUND_12631 [Fusarium mundagurra]